MKIKWAIALCVVSLVLGAMLCSTIRKPEKEKIDIEVLHLPELIALDSALNKQVEIVRGWQKLAKTWKFVTVKGETVQVDSTTPYGAIPIVKTEIDIPVDIRVDGQELRIPFWLVAKHKGEIFDYEVGVWEDRFSTTRPVKIRWIDLSGYAAMLVNYDLHLAAEVEGDLTFKQKITLFGRAYMDQGGKANVAVGIKYIF